MSFLRVKTDVAVYSVISPHQIKWDLILLNVIMVWTEVKLNGAAYVTQYIHK